MKNRENDNISLSAMKKNVILKRLKEQNYRITKQRMTLLDIILEGDCTCCKEIYYKAVKLDSGIGTATVYRMINTLEEIGAINRKNMYQVSCKCDETKNGICKISLDDQSEIELSEQKWKQVVSSGLRCCGYIDGQRLVDVELITNGN